MIIIGIVIIPRQIQSFLLQFFLFDVHVTRVVNLLKRSRTIKKPIRSINISIACVEKDCNNLHLNIANCSSSIVIFFAFLFLNRDKFLNEH